MWWVLLMALQGSLGHLGLADVLQSALAGTGGGNLTLSHGAERAVLHVADDGLHLLEPEVLEVEDLLAAFRERGTLDASALKKARGRGLSDLALIDLLVAEGALSEADVTEAVAGAAEDTILDLLTWREGTFRFEERGTLPARPGLVGRVPVDRSGVLLRAAQRLDEREAITAALGASAQLFVATGAPAQEGDEAEVPTGRVLAALDGSATVDEVGLRLGLGRFTVLKALAALVAGGAARPAAPAELSTAVAARTKQGQLRLARLLVLQWAEADAQDPRPLQVLADLGEARQRPAEVAVALTLLGQRQLAAGVPAEAVRAFTRALEQRPGDGAALEGLRASADAAGDASLWANATLRLATSLLEDEDATRADALANEVLARSPGDLAALLMRAKVCVRTKDRSGIVDVAATVLGALGRRASRRIEREAAQFCRDAVAHLAPERSDLLRALRRLSEARGPGRRRVALVAALVAVAAAAGLYLWPEGSGALLSRAQAAVEAGDRAGALELVAQLLERFPDSAEAEEGARLQSQLSAAASGPKTGARPTAASAETLAALVGALGKLPDAEAGATLARHVGEVPAPAGKEPAPAALVRALEEALGRCAYGARQHLDALASTRAARERSKGDPQALRQLVEAAERGLDPAFRTSWSGQLAPLRRLAETLRTDGALRALREAESALAAYANAAGQYGADLAACRLRLLELEVTAAHEACREQGPRLLVAGDLDAADALYRGLEERVLALAGRPELAEVEAVVRKQGIAEFVRERRALVADVRRGIEAGRAAEAAGNLDAAVAAYEAVAKRHYTIRLDRLIEAPVEVTSLPLAARVRVNGADRGPTPLRLHLPWGVPTTVSVEAPGFEPEVAVLQQPGRSPVTRLQAQLRPVARWEVPVEGLPEAVPQAAGPDVLLVQRGGRILLFAGADGRTRWTRHVKSLEGVRGRAGITSTEVVVAFVDGRVLTLDLAAGEVVGDVTLARPTGDVAVLGELAAVAVATPAVVGLQHGRKVLEVPLPAVPTTSVVAAHGLLWVGTAAGSVVAVSPERREARTVLLGGAPSSVLTLAGTPTGLLATTVDGRLVSLTPAGAVRWTAPNLGDLTTAPAEAEGLVVVADRAGRATLLEAATGAPQASLLLGKPPVGGFRAARGLLAATLADGRLWVLEAASRRVTVEAPLSPKGAAELLLTDAPEAFVLTREGRLLALPLPSAGR